MHRVSFTMSPQGALTAKLSDDKGSMDFIDKRDKRIVYASHCLLNQSTRGPGAAFREAASSELIQILLKNDLNIEQLPCLECVGAGGVSRKSLDTFLPLLSHSIENGWFPLIKPLIKVRLYKYQCLSKKTALKIVNEMNDFLKAGYLIAGIIGINDSPTCGVTKSLDLMELIRRMAIARSSAIPLKKIIQDTLIDGRSYFMGSIISELNTRRMDIKVVGFEPWNDSQENEARRVAKKLNLIV
jgi:predicted secreted protein